MGKSQKRPDPAKIRHRRPNVTSSSPKADHNLASFHHRNQNPANSFDGDGNRPGYDKEESAKHHEEDAQDSDALNLIRVLSQTLQDNMAYSAYVATATGNPLWFFAALPLGLVFVIDVCVVSFLIFFRKK